ncbi:MAG: HK97 gp10 family phage protein [Methylorubrum rhodinum]|uniref:HK97 gp10 family phage protein n=1 Tax=Methylorubrum rhodinum TaxID=29428 RepID=UPI003BAEF1B3
MARNRWENRNRLLRKMKMLPEATKTAIKASLVEGGQEIVAAQKRAAPKKTGALAASIALTMGGNLPKYASFGGGSVQGDPDLTAIISAGNERARHAHLVEFDTAPHINGGRFAGSQHPGTKAQPFFYGPYRALRKRAKSRVTRATRKAARKVAAASS